MPGIRCRRAGWERIDSGRRCTGGLWRHLASGWTVSHCGHPTANYSYVGTDPEQSGMLIPSGWYPAEVRMVKGYAFTTLAAAQAAVEVHVQKLADGSLTAGDTRR